MGSILHLINDASPSRGGAQKILALLSANSLGAAVFSQSREDGREACLENIVGGRFWRISLLLNIFFSRPDVVVVHSRCYMPFSVIFWLLRIRSIFYCHAHYRSQSFLLRLFKFNQYIAVSNSVKGYLVDGGVPESAVTVNHNPLLKPTQLTSGFSSAFKVENFFCVGGLQPWKGFVELLMFRGAMSGNLKIIGDGPLMPELKRLACENKECNTTLLGYSEAPYSLVLDSPIQVIPSLEEGFGLVAIEAMNQGKVIIYSKLPALEEVLREDEYSFSFDHSRSESFAVALESSRELLRQGLDEGALLRRSQFVSEQYRASQFNDRFNAVLTKL